METFNMRVIKRNGELEEFNRDLPFVGKTRVRRHCV